MALIRAQVAIVGGGMVGLALACSIAQRGRSVVVIEKSPAAKQIPEALQLRVSALNLAVQGWLERMNVWQRLPAERLGTYHAMNVWDRDQGGRIYFSAAEADQTHLGTLIENAVVEGALWQHAEELGVKFITGAEITAVEQHEHDVELKLAGVEGEPTVLAQLLVAADGGRSQLRQLAALPVSFKDYEQMGVVATLRTEIEHQGIARQAFLPGGPLALLPMADPNLISVVWSAPSLEANALVALDQVAFEQAITAHSDSCLGYLTLVSERQAFPLRAQYAEQWVKGRLVLVGDAAHTIHPLAGQGANLGLGDAYVLAEHLNELGTLQGQWDPAQLQRALKRYERARKTAALRHLATMEGFHQLFRAQHPLLRVARATGLNLTNKSSAAKRFFLEQANAF
ncbi:FAD-dependent oxidoreductase [Aliidiomarina celeris]|uniref:FAD-dependent oxidoreductase n=1 Tax=Aliidiomarina celeris TaxID=2249428 RepID=UPI000DEB3E29|nr:FAD-dependent oxidoreductase [Aliidiomarina celeris]